MLIKLNVTKIIFALLMSLMMAMMSVQADETVKPQALIEAATNQMLQALQDNEEQLKEEPSLIYSLVQDIVIPNFDFDKMSKLALGKNWRKADKLQKKRFTGEFGLLMIRTYSIAMLEYSTSGHIEILPFKGDLSKKKVTVMTKISQPGGPSIPMAFSMYLNKKDTWKIYDVKINGISLVTNYRSTFATRIRNDGMDKLIDRLAERNKKIKPANNV